MESDASLSSLQFGVKAVPLVYDMMEKILMDLLDRDGHIMQRFQIRAIGDDIKR